ncbi:prolyl hydroxylase family protein [Elongatibacter sediminis]|uniref:2OG-Fe(II) oxygenase n=1 Tax=Elongatibacter sediminis TaxID=3119006 RepID=A0AAW9RDY9_9GAMM
MQIGFPVPNFSPGEHEPCFCRSGKTFGACCGSKAAERSLPAGVLVFPGFVDPGVCNKWVRRLERQPRERATVTDVNTSSGRAAGSRPDPGRVCYDVKPGVLRRKIDDHVRQGFVEGAQRFGQTPEWFETPRILCYKPGGFYHRHADSCQVVRDRNAWYKVRDRDLSLLLYLNEDFKGGGLTFIHFNFHYRPRTGDLLVFPSDNRYEHRAEKVFAGTRYAVVSWAAVAGARRVFAGPPEGVIPFSA